MKADKRFRFAASRWCVCRWLSVFGFLKHVGGRGGVLQSCAASVLFAAYNCVFGAFDGWSNALYLSGWRGVICGALI